MKKCKTPEQQEAWHELLLLTSDPEWFLDGHASERHQKLMRILESDVPKNKLAVCGGSRESRGVIR